MEEKYTQLLKSIDSMHPGVIITSEMLYDIPCIEIDKENLVSLVHDLKANDKFEFNFLTDITVIHYPDNQGRELCGTYLLHNWKSNLILRIKTYVSISDSHLPSLTGVFRTANWLEREAYDNFGMIYDNHPDLRRILNMDDMDYHPLLKQYALEDETRQDKNDTFFGR